MTKDEALDLALEALESCGAGHITDGGNQWHDEKLVDKAITVIKQARSAPVREPDVSQEQKGIFPDYAAPVPWPIDSHPAAQPAPTVQEPVAYRWTNGKGWLTYGEMPDDRFESTPLYTTPPAQPAQQEPVATYTCGVCGVSMRMEAALPAAQPAPVQEPVAWKWHQAPVKTSWGHDMVVADLAIDKDNTVSVYCERDQTAKVEAMLNPPAQPAPVQGYVTGLDVYLDPADMKPKRYPAAQPAPVQAPIKPDTLSLEQLLRAAVYWGATYAKGDYHDALEGKIYQWISLRSGATPPAAPVQEPVAWMHWLNGPCRVWMNKDEAMMELDRLNREYPVDSHARKMRPLVFGDTTPPAAQRQCEDDK